jgi:branched-chain amino acid transport system substrate-binding protein
MYRHTHRIHHLAASALCLITLSCFAQQKEIVVAQVAPFGGPLAVSGRDFNLGAMIAFDEVNSKGGIRGATIRLVSRDDGYRPADTVSHVKDVIENHKPVAFFGMWGSDSVQAVIDSGVIASAEIPVIGIRSGVTSLRGNSNLFHTRASYRDEIGRILGQITTMGSNRVAVAYEDDSFGVEAVKDAQALMDEHKLKPTAIVRLARNQLDVAASVPSLTSGQPQALIVIANTPVAGALIKSMRAAGSSAIPFTTSTVDAEKLASELGALATGVSVAQGIPNPYRASVPLALNFNKRIRELGIDPSRANFSSMEGYVTAKVVIEGLTRATASGSAVTPRDVSRALQAMGRTDLGGFVVAFGKNNNEGSRYVDLSVVGSDGRIRQ